ncbi:MTH1187 family thiamine-binding protein [Thermoanaerobacterium thermosulfurigenes]|uniref:MTH1187 family thiamine-binding protein n=1 Tax=Thermoanaerobacterium thermosulfurigenes TaxID=33950 RepID=UPI003EF0B04F
MSILEINFVPVGTGSASYSSFVQEAVELLNTRGLKYTVTPTSTVIEGNTGELMKVAEEIHNIPFKDGAMRVVTNIMIDERRDKPDNMEKRVSEVIS